MNFRLGERLLKRLTCWWCKGETSAVWELFPYVSYVGSDCDALTCLLLGESVLRTREMGHKGEDSALKTLIWKEHAILMLLSYIC